MQYGEFNIWFTFPRLMLTYKARGLVAAGIISTYRQYSIKLKFSHDINEEMKERKFFCYFSINVLLRN